MVGKKAKKRVRRNSPHTASTSRSIAKRKTETKARVAATPVLWKPKGRALDPISVAQLSGLSQQFDADWKRLTSDTLTQETLEPAVGYVLGYPVFQQAIGANRGIGDAGKRIHAMDALKRVHQAAIIRLTKEAERHGINGGPLVEFGRICRELFEGDSSRYCLGDYDTWPDCLGSARAKLPNSYRTAIRRGEAALHRLNARLETDPEDPIVDLWKKMGGSAHANSAHKSEPHMQAVLASIRRAIVKLPNGIKCKTSSVIATAGVKRQDGLRALRILEAQGEFDGFAKKRPLRFES